jgi:hypothetical protein
VAGASRTRGGRPANASLWHENRAFFRAQNIIARGTEKRKSEGLKALTRLLVAKFDVQNDMVMMRVNYKARSIELGK